MTPKVLIIDDSNFMRSMLKNILIDNRFTIAGEATTGEEGMQKARELDIDLVILDIILPDLNGLEVLRAVKKIKPQVKVVMISSIGQDMVIKEAVENGASDYITKPFIDSEVVSVIKSALENRRGN